MAELRIVHNQEMEIGLEESHAHVHRSSSKWGRYITVCGVNGEGVSIGKKGLYISVVRQSAIKVEESYVQAQRFLYQNGETLVVLP